MIYKTFQYISKHILIYKAQQKLLVANLDHHNYRTEQLSTSLNFKAIIESHICNELDKLQLDQETSLSIINLVKIINAHIILITC